MQKMPASIQISHQVTLKKIFPLLKVYAKPDVKLFMSKNTNTYHDIVDKRTTSTTSIMTTRNYSYT